MTANTDRKSLMFFILLAAYVCLSVASQFLTSKPLHITDIAGVAIWLPLSAVTLVPMVDVMRSFTQHAAEKAEFSFKRTFWTMFGCSMGASALATFAGLPLPIFVGVLAAITFGGLADILVFRKMGEYFKSPVARMAFSNCAATFLGSGIVFAVAFTDLVFANNPLATTYFNAMVGWLCQSFFIWGASVGLGAVTDKVLAKVA